MLSLTLIYVATYQLQLHAESTAQSPSCRVEQKKPFFVGFAPNSGLDDFESATMASRGVFHAVKQWLCGGEEQPAARNGHTPSLVAALAQQRMLRAEQIQFDDVPMSRAHLVLAELRGDQPRERGWHVHVARSPEGWSVSHVSDHRLTEHSAARSQ